MIVHKRGLFPRHCNQCNKVFLKSSGTGQKICYLCQVKNKKIIGLKAKEWWAKQRELKFKNKGVLKI